jgi:hypothetical protein
VGREYQGQNGKARPQVVWVVDFGTAPRKDGREISRASVGPCRDGHTLATISHSGGSAAPGRSPIVTLHIVEIRGRSMWWTWVIRDSTGVLVEESRTQFRSAAEAELRGRARIADLENRR